MRATLRENRARAKRYRRLRYAPRTTSSRGWLIWPKAAPL